MPHKIININPGTLNPVREEGTFEVRFGSETRKFSVLACAYLFYSEIKEAASVWDITKTEILIAKKLLIKR